MYNETQLITSKRVNEKKVEVIEGYTGKVPVGEWITYDSKGEKYKTTQRTKL